MALSSLLFGYHCSLSKIILPFIPFVKFRTYGLPSRFVNIIRVEFSEMSFEISGSSFFAVRNIGVLNSLIAVLERKPLQGSIKYAVGDALSWPRSGLDLLLRLSPFILPGIVSY